MQVNNSGTPSPQASAGAAARSSASTLDGIDNTSPTPTQRLSGPQRAIGEVAVNDTAHLSSNELGATASNTTNSDSNNTIENFGFEIFDVAPFSGGPMGTQSKNYLDSSEKGFAFCYEEPTHTRFHGDYTSLVSLKYMDSGTSKQERYPVTVNIEGGPLPYRLCIPESNKRLGFKTFNDLKGLIGRKLQFHKYLSELPPNNRRAQLANPGDYFLRQSSQSQGIAIDYIDKNFKEKKILLRLNSIDSGYKVTLGEAQNPSYSSIQDALADHPGAFKNRHSL